MSTPSSRTLPAHGHVAQLVVHAVQATQERGLATTRRADERGHGLRRDVHVHAGERGLLAVRDRNVAEVERAGRARRARGARCLPSDLAPLPSAPGGRQHTSGCDPGDKNERGAPHHGRCGLHGLSCHDVEVIRECHDRRERRLRHRREEGGRREDDRCGLTRRTRQPEDRSRSRYPEPRPAARRAVRCAAWSPPAPATPGAGPWGPAAAPPRWTR